MYECCFFLITVLHKRSLEHTTVKVSCKNIMKVILKATKTKAFKYMTTILICYLIHANIYKNNVFVLRYLTQYISHIAAIAEF